MSAYLSSPAEFLEPCPIFRILVLGNPESTKQELFSKIFGVDLEKKLVADAFQDSHDINQELDLEGQNQRLAVYTSPNFGTDNEVVYSRVCDFLRARTSASLPIGERIHGIWYCVATAEARPVSELEKRFFSGDLASMAPHVPALLVFTKYDEFVSHVQLTWSRDAEARGLSKVAVSHILKDLTNKRFEESIGKRWDDVLSDAKGRSRVRPIPRVCVAGCATADDDDSSFEYLAAATLKSLGEWKEWHVKLAFAAAQRNSAAISARYAADAAAEYFSVGTGHARKISGLEMRDIMPNFFAKAVKIFNMRDRASVLERPELLEKVLESAFGADQRPLLRESLHKSGTEPGMLLTLSPHERAVLLVQGLAAVVMFLDKLGDTQWPHRNHDAFPGVLTWHTVEHEIRDIGSGRGRRALLGTIEHSSIFASCPLKGAISDLIVEAVETADKVAEPHGRRASKDILVVDDAELSEISLSFVNDKHPGDMVLPCGLTILPLN